jgi:hypothetical protein
LRRHADPRVQAFLRADGEEAMEIEDEVEQTLGAPLS